MMGHSKTGPVQSRVPNYFPSVSNLHSESLQEVAFLRQGGKAVPEEGGAPYLAVWASLAKGQNGQGLNRGVPSCRETVGSVFNPSGKGVSVGVVASGLGLYP